MGLEQTLPRECDFEGVEKGDGVQEDWGRCKELGWQRGVTCASGAEPEAKSGSASGLAGS